VRGYHPLLAVAAGTGEVLHARRRGGPAQHLPGRFSFHRPDGSAGTRGRSPTGNHPGLGTDSGFCSHKARACHRRDVRFSITIPLHKRLHQTIAALPEEAWTAIPYVLPDAGVAKYPVDMIVQKSILQTSCEITVSSARHSGFVPTFGETLGKTTPRRHERRCII